jgi:hypothetical protein
VEYALTDFTADDLIAILAGDPDELDVYLSLVERDVEVADCKVRMHCHCLAVDGNGRVNLGRLAEFMRNAATDYAIPRSELQKARERDAQFNSGTAVAELYHRAITTFTDLANTGEGGELLLFLLAERFLKVPQVLCKMDLKTDTRVHYHGADGVYASVADDGLLKLYWGESKVYKDVTDAVRDCLASLAPFLVEPEGEDSERERDLVLLSSKADLNDPKLTEAFRRYFDRTKPLSNRVRYCGLAMIGFDAAFYPAADKEAVADALAKAARAEISDWAKKVGKRISEEKLATFEIEFFFVPLPSADAFRKTFLDKLGVKLVEAA